MSVESSVNRLSYSGNGVTTAFTTPYFTANSQVKVIQKVTATGVETAKSLTTHFTLTGAGDDDGGTLTMLVAPPSGTELIIYIEPAVLQETETQDGVKVANSIWEEALDLLTLITRRLFDLSSRSVRLPDGFTGTFDTKLPGILEAGKLLAINEDEDGFTLLENDAQSVAADLADLESDVTALSSTVSTLDSDLNTAEGKIDDLVALTGVAANATDLGTFDGGTISDGRTVKEALQELETAVEGAVAGGSEFADDVFRVQDNGDATKEIAFQASGITTGTTRTITMPDANVNLGDIATLQSDLNVAESDIDTLQSDLDAAEVDIADLQTLTGVAANATDLGAFTGSTIPDGSDIKEALQELETAVESVSGSDISDLETLTGAGTGATDMGSFSGGTIPDGSDIKEALQALETAVESSGGGSPVYFSPVVHRYGAGSGTYDLPYAFTITSGSATAGATYTNNSVTFTVWRTVSGATLVYMTGSGAPASSGTLTKASGTGDATLTFSAFKKPIYLRVQLVAGGGGGAGATSPAGSDGNDSTFGSSLLTALKGAGGGLGNTGGLGGGWTVNSPAIDIGSVGGGDGEGPRGALAQGAGGTGGGNALAGGAPGGNGNGTNAVPAASDSGVGGGGGGGGASNSGQAGGGAGAVVRALIPDPSATYPYVVGAGGAKGTGGSVSSGSDGANGQLVVEAHFQ
jgi:hypothetical protein